MFEVFDPATGEVYYHTKFYWLACLVCWFYGGSDMSLAGRGLTDTSEFDKMYQDVDEIITDTYPRIYNET